MKVLGSCGGTPDTRYPTTAATVNLIYDDDDEQAERQQTEEVVAVASGRVRVGVAVDSGATDNVIGHLPSDVVPGGPVGKPFSNASGGDIKKSSKVTTLMENADGKVGCAWTACAATRPLHSASKIAGLEDGPGLQEVMFDNHVGVVMPPGLVKILLKHIKLPPPWALICG